MEELVQEVTLRGTVPAVDPTRLTFALQQVHGHKIVGPMSEPHRDTIIRALNGYRDNVRIGVHGLGRYDRLHRLSGLESIEQVTLLDPLDVPARLDELRAMQDGWFDGTGKAPSPAALHWLAEKFERHFPEDLPLPHVFPTPAGGIEAEWSLGSYAVILEFDLETRKGDWLRFATDADEEDSRTLRLDGHEGWAWLTGEIRRWAEGEV